MLVLPDASMLPTVSEFMSCAALVHIIIGDENEIRNAQYKSLQFGS